MQRLATIALILCCAWPAAADDNGYRNLKVLPPDISRSEPGNLMLDNLRGLGLPRLAGKGCLYCHVGDLEKPRSEWDHASDAKPMKHKARVMMAMVHAISKDYLGTLETHLDPSFQVRCATCHAGRTDPRPRAIGCRGSHGGSGCDRRQRSGTRHEGTGWDGDVVTSGLLDSPAWRLNRSGREAEGSALIEGNYARFPDSYPALESTAIAGKSAGRSGGMTLEASGDCLTTLTFSVFVKADLEF